MNLNRIWIFFTTVSILFSSLPAQAADSSDLINGKFNAASHKARGEIARDILTMVRHLYSYVPTPKPTESAWVEQEGNEINKLVTLGETKAADSRRIQYYESPEFQQQTLHNALADLQNALSCAAAPSTPFRKEIMCWSVASFLLTNHDLFNNSIPILLKAGRLSKDAIDAGASIHNGPLGFGATYEWYGRGIHEYIVIPYLKDQLK